MPGAELRGAAFVKWTRSSDNIELAIAPTYRYGALPLFAIAVLFIILAPAFWNETQARAGAVTEAYENADLYHYFYPTYHYAFGRLRDGSFPLWNPRQLCGTPLLADARVGVLQPLNLPFLFLPTEQAMAVHAFTCLLLMGLFFTLLARAVGVGYLAAMLGGMVYAFSGFSAAAMSRPPLAAALVWTPLLLWAVREYAHRFDTAAAVIAGMTGALLILTGSYAIALVVGAMAALYTVQSLVVVERGSAEFAKRARGLFVILGVAAGVSAAQWVPTLAHALRLDDSPAWIWGPHTPAQMPASLGEFFAHIILSTPEGQPRAAYVGIVPLVFVPVSIFHRHRRRDVVLYALLAAGGILAAAFFAWRPPLQFPVLALLLPFVIGVALLASIGADRVLIAKTSFRSQTIWLPVLVVLLACAAMFVAFGADVRRYLVPIVPVVLVFALFRARVLLPACYTLLCATLLIDAINAGRTIYTHPRQDAPACYQTYALALSSARDQSLGGRIVPSARNLDRGLTANVGMLASVNAVGGSGIPFTRDQADWWARLTGEEPRRDRSPDSALTPRSPGSRLLRYMAARLVVAAPQGPMYEGSWEDGGSNVREVTPVGGVRMFVLDDALPRAYWVPRARVEVGMPSTIDTLMSPEFDPAQSCVVDAQSKGIEKLANQSGAVEGTQSASPPSATCSIEDVSPERVVVRVDAPRAGVTVLCDSYDPGWGASIDGVRTPILKVNGIFRGVATPEGAHEIVFTYRPWSVYIGYCMSGLVLLAALLPSVRTLARPA
ncbi:MAG: YfhO family protein [Candidatus Hydrogenedentes bacterium]|nr:YfhO family protein [Candidatus Hydrogenedentota bacterium]